MKQAASVAFIGNSLPRRCGIATFTTDLRQAVASSRPGLRTTVVAMTDHGNVYDYPPEVEFQVYDHLQDDYGRVARALNAAKVDVVCLQHEFGIFGGAAGSHVLSLISPLNMPVVTTLHTVLSAPTPIQRSVMERIIEMSSRVVVMAEKARELLETVYNAPSDKTLVIPHGIPDYPFVEPDEAKAALGFADRPVILTFGLLSPNKGIEVMIDAMPSILRSRPDAVYVVLGATHPNLVRQQGEAYRESLKARARGVGVEDNVVFLDQFVDRATLLRFISMCDVYVTPYLNEAQMTSGTLAYSYGLGKPVVSTPYWHARELLADGKGILVPFGDTKAIGEEIARLLSDDDRRQAMRERAYAGSRSMTWERTAERYLAAFDEARGRQRLRVVARPDSVSPPQAPAAIPAVKTDCLLSMCDDTGIYQHAVHSVPDRAHGYCVDDNARALLLAASLNQPGEQRLPEILTARFAAFVQHAWNPDRRRFRNFMSFGRLWLEEIGSEDSHGRALWALGACALNDVSPSRRRWAKGLFKEASAIVGTFTSPRAWAFTLLGLDAYCAAVPADGEASQRRGELATRLMSLLSTSETSGWVWFEDGLAYDNARLPQALILAGVATGSQDWTAAGLRSLRWLTGLQTSAAGQFRPVGSQSFGDKRQPPRQFDQQPLEAAATISACRAALCADGDTRWIAEAERAFAWFLGANDLGLALADPETGGCRDGLHPDRANENQGGESVLSYLLGLVEIRQLARATEQRLKSESLRTQRASAPAGTISPSRTH